MTALPVSVVVVSRGRPALLTRCLTGLGQLFHPCFEIIVVADPAGCAAVLAMGWRDRVKLIELDRPNISQARNLGVKAAAGDVVAFIDDDAVPEPTWLDHLVAPFADPEIAVTGGFVIGRNGISFQWQARAVDRLGRMIPIDHAATAPFEPELADGWAVKTEGTNFAVRRDRILQAGGFDEAFHFFLDETDLNLRLARSGARTTIVPLAIVHHGYAASSRRAGDRAPTDMTEIGASSAVFLRRHAPDADFEHELARIKQDRRNALLRYMVDGGLEPRDVGARLHEIETGFRDGLQRHLAALAPLASSGIPFLQFQPSAQTKRSRFFAGRPWNRRHLQDKARAAVAAGDVVTVFQFSPTARPHRVRFHPGGWWEQRGGLFGPARRDERKIRLSGFRARVECEWRRVAAVRQCRNGT